MITGNPRTTLGAAIIAAALLFPVGLRAAATPPPKSWIDPDTGHRVHRITDEPDTLSFYFNVNPFTPDGKQMVFTTPEGIAVMDLATFKTRTVVPGPARAVVVGRKTPRIFYIKGTERALKEPAYYRPMSSRPAPRTAVPRRQGPRASQPTWSSQLAGNVIRTVFTFMNSRGPQAPSSRP